MKTTTHTGRYRVVPVDLYRNIHKGIRAELFAVAAGAGSMDPGDDADVDAVLAHLADVAALLEMHAGHEEQLDALIRQHAPTIADQVEQDHRDHADELPALLDLATGLRASEPGERRALAQLLHLDLSRFVGDYLAHQDLEEREVMPALHDAVGPTELAAVQQRIVASIPPQVMAKSLAFMLPAMNVDDRAEHLGAMQVHAPAEAFERAWGLAASVLTPDQVSPLAARLGVAR